MPRKTSEQFEEYSESEITSRQNKSLINPDNLISSGSTMLNLAATGTPYGCFLKGRYYLLVGGSSSGKTWLEHSVFAETTLHPKFKKYRLIRDNPELGADFDVAYFFGKKTESRIEEAWPDRVDENGIPQPNSRTVEEFYDNVNSKLDEVEAQGNGLVYALDSMDSLTTDAFIRQTEEAIVERKKGKEAKGSYGDGKAKINSQRLRDLAHRLNDSGSILIIICQERDDIGSQLSLKTWSGGNATLFYAAMQIWLKKIGRIEAQVCGKKRVLGTQTKAQILKNRITGQQDRDIPISYYYSFGMDDIGDTIDFLLSEKHWEGGGKSTSKIDATEFNVKMDKEGLIEYLQDDAVREEKLREIAGEVWSNIQEEIAKRTKRKSRYV